MEGDTEHAPLVHASERSAATSSYLVRLLLALGAYLVTARLGLGLDAVGGVATTVWPPTGIALATLLLGGRRYWPAIALGALVTNLSAGAPVAAALAMACGNTLEALVGASLLQRVGFRAALDRVRDVLALVLLGALLSTTLSATIGVTSAWLGGLVASARYADAWFAWWVGDVLGALIVAPALLLAPAIRAFGAERRKLGEGGLLLACLVGLGLLIFSAELPRAYSYFLFVPLLWAAVRFGPSGAVLANFATAVVAIAGTAMGYGPFLHGSRGESLLYLQVFMGVVSTTILMLAAVTAERRAATAALHQKHAFVAAILETVGLVAVLDRRGRIVRFNGACERATGLTAALAHGRRFWDVLVAPEDAAAVRELFEPMLAEPSAAERAPTGCEARLPGRLGERIIAWSATPLSAAAFGEAGGEHAIVGGTDVTERRQLEARLVLADRLGAMGTLAAGVGHEINNPLAYLLLNLDMAERLVQLDHQSQQRTQIMAMLHVAREGAERVRDIVADLKTLARGDDHGRALLDVRTVLDGALNMTEHELRQRARLVRAYGEVPLVEANQGRLLQVFVNLLVNAAQAIDEGDPAEHEIRVTTGIDEAGRAVVAVGDTGCGIERDALGRLFEPFFTTKPVGIGTGLGLAVCHGIVTQLGGEIEVDSEPGRGSTFRVRLPAARARSVVRQSA